MRAPGAKDVLAVLGIMLWGALICAALLLISCSTPLHVQPPISLEIWTDADGEPNPLDACQRLTGETGEGTCVVITMRALAWWQRAWTDCELELDDCREVE